MRPRANLSADLPARVTVLGFARSGRALAEALSERGLEVVVVDDKPADEVEGWRDFEKRGVRFFLGGREGSDPFREGSDPPRGSDPGKALDGSGWLALSPGVPPSHPLVAAARRRGLAILSEFEIAWRIAEAETTGENRWVGVTGTNGKSTTTAWIAEILRFGERPVALAGNIGAPLSGFLAERRPRDFVCELSSFQLETIERFRPDVAVLTNVTPDHLDRYPGFEEYAATKERIFVNQRGDDLAVVNADDPVASRATTRARRVPFSRRAPAPGGTWCEGGRLYSEVRGARREVLAADRLSLPGAHNLENALAALAAAECLEAPPSAIEKGLTGFRGLPHRTEKVAEASGVTWVNDSKGTNVDATAKSLEGRARKSVLLILGGRDKHGDFAKLAGPVTHAARIVLTIGEAAPVIEAALAGTVLVESCRTLEEAVARAASLARRGDTVLLSPACASFDQYRDFEERGRHFTELAQRLTAHGSRLTAAERDQTRFGDQTPDGKERDQTPFGDQTPDRTRNGS
ncbi:MAG TPA: UDP-N-acetylmuramoyl-L-alanine--D-glutamate ligase [Thermoanaerobaculia bacterium]|jgi:UDP-N-acetylmuramoylalanine--D-glutamate ligase|nr:UDP-N-acetylmuramoyl-L-alanine--D-glutamate ligase [Thermoanaerobaculia bacterium]